MERDWGIRDKILKSKMKAAQEWKGVGDVDESVEYLHSRFITQISI